MCKIMYNRALFHKICESLIFSRRHEQRSICFTPKGKPFRGLENAELLDHCLFFFYMKTENFGFWFHLKHTLLLIRGEEMQASNI